MQHLVESGRIVQVREPSVGPNAGDQDGNWVDLSDAQMVYIVINTSEGDGQDYTLTVRETDGTTPQDLQVTVPLYHNDDTSDDDLMTRQANAFQIAVTGSTDDKLTVFAVDPARLSDGYDRVTLRVTSAGDASNQDIGAVAIILPARYKDPRST